MPTRLNGPPARSRARGRGRGRGPAPAPPCPSLAEVVNGEVYGCDRAPATQLIVLSALSDADAGNALRASLGGGELQE